MVNPVLQMRGISPDFLVEMVHRRQGCWPPAGTQVSLTPSGSSPAAWGPFPAARTTELPASQFLQGKFSPKWQVRPFNSHVLNQAPQSSPRAPRGTRKLSPLLVGNSQHPRTASLGNRAQDAPGQSLANIPFRADLVT